MQRWKFPREFKVGAVRPIRERGVSAAQAARDLDVHENVLRKWVRELACDPKQAFPGHGQMKPEQLKLERMRREVAKLRMERDIQRKAASFFARGSISSSSSSRSTGAYGRRHGCAKRCVFPVPASRPGGHARPVRGLTRTRSLRTR